MVVGMMRKKWSTFGSSLFAFFGVLVLLASMVTWSAVAATAPSMIYTDVSVSKIADGTGHGTSAQTFVNSKNGFTPGDNTPTDGVVSSGDTVEYSVRLDFTAARARQVWVGFELDEETGKYLRPLNTQACQTSGIISSTSRNGGCLYTVPAGATGSITQTLMLLGLDTKGTAVSGLRPKVAVVRYNSGAAVNPEDKQVYPADPVTVVSAPAADVVVRNFDNNTANGKAERRTEYKPNDESKPAMTGYFDLSVEPLHYPGYSSHGASTSGQWSATVDVSKFPAGTTWQVVRDNAAPGNTDAGTPVALTPSGGKISLTDLTGDKTAKLEWSIPYDKVAELLTGDEQTSTLSFDIQVIPAANSFESTSGGRTLKNLGTGTEPGRDRAKEESTEDANTGARAGYPYVNNDWSRAIIDKKEVTGDIYYKELRVPYAPGKTKFDAESKTFASAAPDAPSQVVSVPDKTNQVASGTQVRTTLGAKMANIVANGLATTTQADKPHYIGDTWKADEQEYVGNVRVQQGSTVLSRGTDYVLEYTTTSYAPGDVPADGRVPEPTNWTWTAGDPTASLAGSVTGVRARILDSAISKLATGSGAQDLTMTFDVKVHKDASQGNEKLIDTGVFALRPGPRVQGLGFGVYQGSVTVVPPITPSAVIRNTLTVKAVGTGEQRGQITHTSNGEPTPDPIAGGLPADQVEIKLTPYAWQTYSGIAMTPVVRLAYPQGLTGLRLADGPWEMKEVGSGAERTLEFRLKQDNGVITPAVTRDGAITLPDVVITGAVANNYGGTVPVSAQYSYTTQPKDDIASVTVQSGRADTSLVMNNAKRGGGVVYAEPRTEINDPLHFEFNVEGRGANRTGTLTSVINLPTNQDQNLLYNNGKGLDGSWNDYERTYSHYNGSYTLPSEVVIDTGNSSNTTVFYSTTALNGIPLAYRDDPNRYSWKTWEQLSPAEKGQVTAIKVVSDFADLQGTSTDGQVGRYAAAHGTITLQPSGNREDDEYNIWLGRNYYSDGSSNDPLPWADKEVVVSSTISGTVWWDQNDNASIDTDAEHPENSEERIQGVTVSLYRADQVGANGEVSGSALAETLTDANGFYEFTGLHSGEYVTVVKRATGTVTGGSGKGVQTVVTSYYNESLGVKNTVTYAAQIGEAARDFSQVIHLGIDDAVNNVDFGYLKPDPKVTLDKTHVSTDCGNDSCEVKWDVAVQNRSGDGRSVLSTDTGALLRDRMSSEVTNVKVTAGTQSITPDTYHKIKEIARVRYRAATSSMNVRSVSVFIDHQGKPWVWGPNTDILENGEAAYCGNSTASYNPNIGFRGKSYTVNADGNEEMRSYDGAICLRNTAARTVSLITWESAYKYFYGGRSLEEVKAEWNSAQLSESSGAAVLPLLSNWEDWRKAKGVQRFERIESDGENRFLAIDDQGRAWTWGDRPILASRYQSGSGDPRITNSDYTDIEHLERLESNGEDGNHLVAMARSAEPQLIQGLPTGSKVADVFMDQNEITVRTDKGEVYAIGERIADQLDYSSTEEGGFYTKAYCRSDRHDGYSGNDSYSSGSADSTSSANAKKRKFMRVSFNCDNKGNHIAGMPEPSIISISTSSSVNQTKQASDSYQGSKGSSRFPSFAVDSTGAIYWWHVSGDMHKSYYRFSGMGISGPKKLPISLPSGVKAREVVSFGDDYALALGQNGKLYIWRYSDWMGNSRLIDDSDVIDGTNLPDNAFKQCQYRTGTCPYTDGVKEVGAAGFADGKVHNISDIAIYNYRLYAIDSEGAVIGLQRSHSREGAALNVSSGETQLAIRDNAVCSTPSEQWLNRIQAESLGDGQNHTNVAPGQTNCGAGVAVNKFQTILPPPSVGSYRLSGNVTGPAFTQPSYGRTWARRSSLPAIINTATGEAYTWDLGILADQMNIGNAWKPWNEQTPTLITSPQLIKAVKQAGNASDPTAFPVAEKTSVTKDGTTTRSYELPNQLLPKPSNPAEGDRVIFHMTGTVRKPSADAGTLNVGNQAWFSADRTPYYSTQPAPDGTAEVKPASGNAVGVPHARTALSTSTGTAVEPLKFSLSESTMKTLHDNGGDVISNASCAVGSTYRTNTNTLEEAENLEHSFVVANEDSCDQAWTRVAALPPGETPILGSVSGYYWYDDGTPEKYAQYRLWPRKLPTRENPDTPEEGNNPNAPRFPGQVVTLFNKDGEVVATTVTNSDNYYKFTDLPLGEYSVQFSRVANRDFISNPDFFCKGKSGAALTTCLETDFTSKGDGTPKGDGEAPWDSDASVNEDTYGAATPKIIISAAKLDWVHIDAGVSDVNTQPTGTLPITGLGHTLPLLLLLGLGGLVAAVVLLREK